MTNTSELSAHAPVIELGGQDERTTLYSGVARTRSPCTLSRTALHTKVYGWRRKNKKGVFVSVFLPCILFSFVILTSSNSPHVDGSLSLTPEL